MTALYHLGCPVWSNKEWIGEFFSDDARPKDFLSQYASVFNTVEGNSTFYGLPKPDTVKRWHDETPAGFDFCFKFPRVISHDSQLQHAESETREFLERLTLLQDRLGPIFLQLPPRFDGQSLPILKTYLAALPDEFSYAVEVRHQDFFAKQGHERSLNRMLRDYAIDRVVFDSRALFNSSAEDSATLEAQRKKPHLPVHVVATATNPLIRFVGHPELTVNRHFLIPWIKKLTVWIAEGRRPYFFTHMANDYWAPHLGQLVHTMLLEAIPEVGELSPWPAARQVRLF